MNGHVRTNSLFHIRSLYAISGALCLSQVSSARLAAVGGYVPQFDASSWVIWEDFSEREFEEAWSYATEHRAGLSGTHRRTMKVELPPEVVDRYAAVLSTREHEWTHWRQHMSTGYGLLMHRLGSIQDVAYVQYLGELSNPRSLSDLVIRHSPSTVADSAKKGHLSKVVYARLLEGALWKKTLLVEDLLKVSRIVDLLLPETGITRSDVVLGMQCSWPSNHQSCLQEISVEMCAEAFARFREYHELGVHFKHDDVIRFMNCRPNPVASLPLLFVSSQLRVEPQHPIVGALIELALSLVPDPEFYDAPFIWERHHPGYALISAVHTISERGVPDGLTFQTAYELAAEAFGTSIEEVSSIYGSMADALEKASARRDSDVDSMKAKSLAGIVEIYRAAVTQTFALGMRLRSDAPWIFCFPQYAILADQPELWNRFVEATHPLLVVGTVGAQEWCRTLQELVLVTAMPLNTAIPELRNAGSLTRTTRLLESYRSLIDPRIRHNAISLLRAGLPDYVVPMLPREWITAVDDE